MATQSDISVSYRELLEQIRDCIRLHVPYGSTVLIVSRGDEALVRLDGYRAWHFPRTESGTYAGHHPADSVDAIRSLRRLRSSGAQYLVFPWTARWWLEFYRDLATHLQTVHELTVSRDGVCLIYKLSESADPDIDRQPPDGIPAREPIQLASLVSPKPRSSTRILTILARFGTDQYPDTEQEIGNIFESQMPAVDRSVVIVDNALPHHFVQERNGEILIGGDNTAREFSAFDRALDFVGSEIWSYDLVHFATSAFNTLYVAYRERFDTALLRAIAGRPVCVGHIDCYNEPIDVLTYRSQHWMRTCFVMLPPAEARALGSFVSVRDGAPFFSGNPHEPFRIDAPISLKYREYITQWLTGDDIGQGVEWHSGFALTDGTLPMFEHKALSILNEHLLGIRLRALGCHLIDVTWLSTMLQRMGSMNIPWATNWREQLRNRDRDALVLADTKRLKIRDIEIVNDAQFSERVREIPRLVPEIVNVQERVSPLSISPHDRNSWVTNARREFVKLNGELTECDRRLATLQAERRRLEGTIRSAGQSIVTRAAEVQDIAPTVSSRRNSPPTILMVSHVGPWRPRAGNEYRVRRMLCWFRERGYRIIPVIAPLPGEELPRAGIEATAAEFGNAIQCHRDGRLEYVLNELPDVFASQNGTMAPSFANLLGEDTEAKADERDLIQLERMFCHDAVISTVLQLERILGKHVLQVEYIWMTRLLPLIRRDVLKVIDTIDVFSSIQEKVTPFGLRDVLIEPHQEAERLRRGDLLIAIQDVERAELERLTPSVPVITAGVDFDVIDGRASSVRRILYVASDNPRNCKGLDDFLCLAWPRIQRAVPGVELQVVGDVAKTIAMRELPHVRAIGPLDDLAGQYQDASLVINPAVAGTGLKIKILEALCHCRPVVTWPTGIEGLDPKLASFCLVARDWYEFSEHVVEVLSRPMGTWFSSEDRAEIAELVASLHVYASLDASFSSFFNSSDRPSEPIPHAKRAVVDA